jgi:hypothetical protein
MKIDDKISKEIPKNFKTDQKTGILEKTKKPAEPNSMEYFTR